MLENKTIHLSHNRFSSSVLLVKKKDGLWYFCIDYKALNKVMIKDCFSILTMNDMIDKLHDANCFYEIGSPNPISSNSSSLGRYAQYYYLNS